jgi:hypothetical protein
MSTNYTTENPRRSRGGRRRSRRGGSNRSNETSSRSSSNSSSSRGSRGYQPREPKKLTLWEKIVAFFTGGSKPAAKPAARATAPAAKPAAAAEPKAERKPRTGMRKPEAVEVTSPRLYVGNLSFDASESDLFDLFNGVGIVQNVEVVSNRQTQRSKGFAFVQMQTVEEAKRAVGELHDKEYMGRKLVVSGAKAVERREEREERAPQESQEQPIQAQQPEQ